MTFIRVEYDVVVQEKDNPEYYIAPQSVVVVYRVQEIPTANVEMAFGETFDSSGIDNQQAWRDLVEKWSNGRTALQIRVIRNELSVASAASPRATDQIIFEGYLYVPSLQLQRKGGSYTFQLQHWTRDLTIGSMIVGMARPLHPGNPRVGILNQEPDGADLTASPRQLEGIVYRAGLPNNFRSKAADDIWGLVQKPILAALLMRNNQLEFQELFTSCADAMNVPSRVAMAALQRVQGPSPDLGSPYRDGAVPITLARSMTGEARAQIGEAIASAIGDTAVGSFANTTAWTQIMSFCAQFGLLFVARSEDAVIMPAAYGVSNIYDVEIQEQSLVEVAWSSSQQMTLRGLGMMTRLAEDMNGVDVASRDPKFRPHGCFIRSASAEDGMVAFIQPPSWLDNLPVGSTVSMAAKRSLAGRGLNNPPPIDGEPVPGEVEADRLFRGSVMQNIYDAYAKFRFFESELFGRIVRLSTTYRTDIAPGSTVRIRLRPEELTARLNVKAQSLVAMVTGLTLSINRPRRQAVTAMELNYTRTEAQLADPQYNLPQHPLYEQMVPGISLVTNP